MSWQHGVFRMCSRKATSFHPLARAQLWDTHICNRGVASPFPGLRAYTRNTYLLQISSAFYFDHCWQQSPTHLARPLARAIVNPKYAVLSVYIKGKIRVVNINWYNLADIRTWVSWTCYWPAWSSTPITWRNWWRSARGATWRRKNELRISSTDFCLREWTPKLLLSELLQKRFNLLYYESVNSIV